MPAPGTAANKHRHNLDIAVVILGSMHDAFTDLPVATSAGDLRCSLSLIC